MALEEYVRKRKFEKTPEPPPSTKAPAAAASPRFYVQRHDATRLHYDFRLEIGGVLVSVGRAQRPFARAALQVPGRQSRRSSARIRRIRRQHSRRQLRRGQRHAVGPRHMGIAGRQAGRRAARARRPEVPPARRKAEGRIRHGPHEESRQRQRVAAHQEARCRCRARLGHRAVRLERAFRPHAAGDRAGPARPQDQAGDRRRSPAPMEESPWRAGFSPRRTSVRPRNPATQNPNPRQSRIAQRRREGRHAHRHHAHESGLGRDSPARRRVALRGQVGRRACHLLHRCRKPFAWSPAPAIPAKNNIPSSA